MVLGKFNQASVSTYPFERRVLRFLGESEIKSVRIVYY
jgi:hypothetical protein